MIFLPWGTNLCKGTRNCFVPSGGGPDPNECHVIADALLFDSQNVGTSFDPKVSCELCMLTSQSGALFTIPANASVVTMQFRSCLTFFVNQAGVDEQFCRSAWVRKNQNNIYPVDLDSPLSLPSLTTLLSIVNLLRTHTVETASLQTNVGSFSMCHFS